MILASKTFFDMYQPRFGLVLCSGKFTVTALFALIDSGGAVWGNDFFCIVQFPNQIAAHIGRQDTLRQFALADLCHDFDFG